MQLFVLVVVGILTGVLCTEETCKYKAQENCRVFSILPYPLPSNEEELQKSCSNLTKIKLCIDDNIRNCNPEADEKEDEEEDEYEYRRHMTEEDLEQQAKMVEEILKYNKRLIDLATEICQEDSELHASLVPDLSCYREIFDTNDKDQRCMNYTRNALNYLRSRLDKISEETREEFSQHSYCLSVLFDMNCFVEQFNSKCSSIAKDTALEIIRRAGSLDEQCPVPIRLEILELLDNLKSLIKEDIHVRQLIETDSL